MNIFRCCLCCCRKDIHNGRENYGDSISETSEYFANISPVALIINGRLNILKEVLKDEENLNSSESGYKPIHWAAWHGQLEVVKLCIEYGALYDEPNEMDQNTPLALAAYKCHPEIVSFLIPLGCNLNNGDHEMDTALHYAVFNGMTESVKLLLDNGADPNARNDRNVTPVWYSVQLGNKGILKLLLDVNAKMEVKSRGNDDDGPPYFRNYLDPVSPLYVAVENIDLDAIELMLSAGYNVKNEEWLHDDEFPESARQSYVVKFLKTFISSPVSLKLLCCNFIRNHFGAKTCGKVTLLEIPTSLKKILLLEQLAYCIPRQHDA